MASETCSISVGIETVEIRPVDNGYVVSVFFLVARETDKLPSLCYIAGSLGAALQMTELILSGEMPKDKKQEDEV